MNWLVLSSRHGIERNSLETVHVDIHSSRTSRPLIARKFTHVAYCIGFIDDFHSDKSLDHIFHCDQSKKFSVFIYNQSDVALVADQTVEYL